MKKPEPVRPPDIAPRWAAPHPCAKTLAALWYGVECRRAEGPDAATFELVAELLSDWAARTGRPLVVDRLGYNRIKPTVQAWVESGQAVGRMVDAALVPDGALTDWERAAGWGSDPAALYASVSNVNRLLERRRGKSKPGYGDPGFMQAGSPGIPDGIEWDDRDYSQDGDEPEEVGR